MTMSVRTNDGTMDERMGPHCRLQLMTTRVLSFHVMIFGLLAAGCSPSTGAPPSAALKVADMPAIDGAAMLADIKQLSSDEFEGRAPGTKGEELSVNYIVERFQAAGVEPGNPDGTWTQKVPLVGITPSKTSPLTVVRGGRSQSFRPREQVVAFSPRVTDAVSVEKSEMVFVGYGVQAPEFQ